MTTASRFRLLDMPVAIPGCCHICGSVGDGKRQFIDLGITVEFTGVIYFCTLCMAEAVTIMGYVDPEEFKALRSKIKVTEKKLENSENERSRLSTIVDAIDILRNHSDDASGDSSQRGIEAIEQSIDDVESEFDNVERSFESLDVGGRKNVSNHASSNRVK